MFELLKKVFARPTPRTSASRAPGLVHFVREHDGRPVRYHLRVEKDGSGLLLANATAAVRLSPVGVAVAHALLSGSESDDALVRRVLDGFAGAPLARVKEDVGAVRALIDELADPMRSRGRYPLRSLDDLDATVHRRAISAPLSADVTTGGDLDTMLEILERLWDAAIPQVIFTVTSDTPARDLIRLVERAEDLGMIAGVRAHAGRLEAEGLLEGLAQAGLDHVDVPYAGEHDHDALFSGTSLGDHEAVRATFRQALELEVFPVAVVPIVSSTFERFESIAEELVGLGVEAMIAFALVSEDEDGLALTPEGVRQAAVMVEEVADHRDIELVWAPPVERDASRDALELVQRGPRTAGEASMRVAADGTVTAPEGPPTPAGNLLRQPWAEIWGQSAFSHYREAIDDPDPCEICPGLLLCAAGCPARRSTWACSEPRDTQ